MSSTKIWRYYENLEEYVEPGKVLVLFGCRRIGKSTLLADYICHALVTIFSKVLGKDGIQPEDNFFELGGDSIKAIQAITEMQNKGLTVTIQQLLVAPNIRHLANNAGFKSDSGDNLDTQHTLSEASFETIKNYVQGYHTLVIDEAQNIPNLGKTLKIMVDEHPYLKIIVTGSAAFELAGQVGEPLTGRKRTLSVYPIAQLELLQHYQNNPATLKSHLEECLIYGAYPDVLTAESKRDKQYVITEIAEAYLFKDILTLENLKHSKKLADLLRLLAHQVGSEVSLSELGRILQLDAKTVARYLDLLEKSFIIYNLRGFSRNLRSEIQKMSKYYFYDNGIRNALIANFNDLESRNDIGQLWENFLVIERLKKQSYLKIRSNNYFWRTHEQQKIDWVEERGGQLHAYEFKWNNTKIKIPPLWKKNYPDAEFKVITAENFIEFVTGLEK